MARQTLPRISCAAHCAAHSPERVGCCGWARLDGRGLPATRLGCCDLARRGSKAGVCVWAIDLEVSFCTFFLINTTLHFIFLWQHTKTTTVAFGIRVFIGRRAVRGRGVAPASLVTQSTPLARSCLAPSFLLASRHRPAAKSSCCKRSARAAHPNGHRAH